MNKAVVVTAHRRPEYLDATLDALLRCDGVDGWRVVIVLDRPDDWTASIASAASMSGWETFTLDLANEDDPPYSRTSRATLMALALGFVTADYVVHLEEDCVPHPDLLTWHAQMAERYRHDLSVFTVNAWTGPVRNNPEPVYIATHFTPWAWATWADRWDEIRADWSMEFWDRRLNEWTRGSRFGVFPNESKVTDIGRIGYRPESTQEWEARQAS